MLELSADLVALLVGAAFIAGAIDSIAGGGGLITVPALLLAGLPPVTALATNKVQGAFGSGMAAISYAASGLVDLRGQIRPAIASFLAALAGSSLVPFIPTDLLRLILPAVLIAIALFFALKPGLSDEDRIERLPPAFYSIAVAPLIALYDGFVGPGAGSFFMIGFVLLAGYGVLKATAHTKLLNFASNLGSIIAFALAGAPLWGLGLAMGLAQAAGARVGARLAVRSGARLIKPLLVATSTVLALRLIWQMA